MCRNVVITYSVSIILHAAVCHLAQVLNELVDFMSDPYARCKDHQKLLRNLKVLYLVMCHEIYWYIKNFH